MSGLAWLKPVAKHLAGTAILAAAGFLASGCAGAPAAGPTDKPAAFAPSSDAPAQARGANPLSPRSLPRMAWTLTAPSGAVAFVQGTLHLGSDALYPLDRAVTDALVAADLALGELSSADMERSTGVILERMSFSLLSRGRTLDAILSAEDVAYLKGALGAEGYRFVSVYQPWVAYSYLDGIVAAKAGLSAERGIDAALYAAAAAYGKAVAGLESIESQLDVLAGPSVELQTALLRDSVREYRSRPGAIEELFEAYRKDDRRGLARAVAEALSRSNGFSKDLAAFNESLLDKRNMAWAERIDSLMKDGKNLFIFAGVAHFVGEGSVLELLKAKGYTVRP